MAATPFEYKNKKGTLYYLNTKSVKLKGSGKVQVIYFFSKDVRKTGCPLPEGYKVLEVERTGLPVLKRK